MLHVMLVYTCTIHTALIPLSSSDPRLFASCCITACMTACCSINRGTSFSLAVSFCKFCKGTIGNECGGRGMWRGVAYRLNGTSNAYQSWEVKVVTQKMMEHSGEIQVGQWLLH